MANIQISKEDAEKIKQNMKVLADKIAKQREDIKASQAKIDEHWTGPSRVHGEEYLNKVYNVVNTYMDTVETSFKQHAQFLEKGAGILFN